MWWWIFAGVPLLSLHLSTYSFTGVSGSILGAILKPLFVFPLGLGVLGMAFGLGGILSVFFYSPGLKKWTSRSGEGIVGVSHSDCSEQCDLLHLRLSLLRGFFKGHFPQRIDALRRPRLSEFPDISLFEPSEFPLMKLQISWLTFDLLVAFGVGTLMTILVEFPCLTLQKMCLPQVKPAAKKLE